MAHHRNLLQQLQEEYVSGKSINVPEALKAAKEYEDRQVKPRTSERPLAHTSFAPTEAFRVYKWLANTLGDRQACAETARCYEHGIGTATNLKKAHEYVELAGQSVSGLQLSGKPTSFVSRVEASRGHAVGRGA